KAYWRWKSRGQLGRPRIERELRDLIHRMSEIHCGAQGRRVDRLQVHDPTLRAAVPDLADIPAQSCGGYCSNLSLRCSDAAVRAPVCLSCCGPWPAPAVVVCGNPESDSGMDGPTDRTGVPVEHGADLFGARQ